MRARGNLGKLTAMGPLMASAFLLFGFNNTATSAMPEYVMAMGGGALLAGAQNSLFVLMAVVLRLFFGPLADRVGGKRMLLLGAAGFCLPCALLPLCTSLWAALGLRLLQCVGLAAFHPNVAFYITEHTAPQQRARFISAARFASTASLMVVPAALFPLIGSAGYGAFFTALAFVGFAGLLLVLPLPGKVSGPGEEGRSATMRSLPDDPPSPRAAAPKSGGSTSALVQSSNGSGPVAIPAAPGDNSPSPSPGGYQPLLRAAIAMPALLACGYSVLLVFGPSYLLSVAPQLNNGLLLSAVSVGGLAGSLAAAALGRCLGTRRSCALTTACFAIGLTVMLAQFGGPAALLLGGSVTGFGYFGGTTLLNAYVGQAADPRKAGRLFAQQQSFLDGGMMAGSLLAGGLLQAGAGYQLVLGVTALLLAAGTVVWAMPHRGGQ